MKTTLTLCAAALLLTGFAPCTQSAPIDFPCGAKEAVFLVDYSGSMMESFNQDEAALQEAREKAKANASLEPRSEKDKAYEKLSRISYTLELLQKAADAYPISEKRTALYTAAPFTTPAPLDQRSSKDFTAAKDSLKTNLEVLGRRTPLGLNFEDLSKELTEKKAYPAVLLFTNGENNRGPAALEGLKSFYREHPGSCLSIVSFAETDTAREELRELAALKPCSHLIDARTVYKEDGAFERFLKEVFSAACEDKWELTGIHFAHDSAAISPVSDAVLQKALEILRKNTRPVQITGWTDSTGSDAYNRTLSLRRAVAVKNWLIAHGIAAERLSVTGAGKSFKYDNATAEGRYQNRRMEFELR